MRTGRRRKFRQRHTLRGGGDLFARAQNGSCGSHRRRIETCRRMTFQTTRARLPRLEFKTDTAGPRSAANCRLRRCGCGRWGRKVSIGNPHFVIFVENFQDGWQRQAALIGTQPQFPQGTNVEYVVVRGENEIEIRLFERGVGETESSGTGSCASAVAAIASGRVASPVTVIAPGGSQTVRWQNQVYLRGPATLICRGEFYV